MLLCHVIDGGVNELHVFKFKCLRILSQTNKTGSRIMAEVIDNNQLIKVFVT